VGGGVGGEGVGRQRGTVIGRKSLQFGIERTLGTFKKPR
jgi:hypothetical protein